MKSLTLISVAVVLLSCVLNNTQSKKSRDINSIGQVDSVALYSLLPGFLAFDESEITSEYVIENGHKGFMFQSTSYQFKSGLIEFATNACSTESDNPSLDDKGGCRTVMQLFNSSKQEAYRIEIYQGLGKKVLIHDCLSDRKCQDGDYDKITSYLNDYFPLFF